MLHGSITSVFTHEMPVLNCVRQLIVSVLVTNYMKACSIFFWKGMLLVLLAMLKGKARNIAICAKTWSCLFFYRQTPR